MKKKKPNFHLITSDQQHWNTLGSLNPEIKTPALDRLAAQGTLFNRSYCVNPTCTAGARLDNHRPPRRGPAPGRGYSYRKALPISREGQ